MKILLLQIHLVRLKLIQIFLNKKIRILIKKLGICVQLNLSLNSRRRKWFKVKKKVNSWGKLIRFFWIIRKINLNNNFIIYNIYSKKKKESKPFNQANLILITIHENSYIRCNVI